MKNLNSCFIVMLIYTVVIFGLLVQKFNDAEINNNLLKTLHEKEVIIKQKEDLIEIEQYKIDSVNTLLSAKNQTIINNKKTNEKRNKQIAAFNYSATDSLYRQNLQSNYKKYGYLLIDNK